MGKKSKTKGSKKEGAKKPAKPTTPISSETHSSPSSSSRKESPLSPGEFTPVNPLELARSKYAQLNVTEKAEVVEVTSKRFEIWLKQWFNEQIEECPVSPSSPSGLENVESPTKRVTSASRRCLSVPPAYYQGERYPVNIPLAMHAFLMNGNVFSAKLFKDFNANHSHFERKSPRLSLPNVGGLKEVLFTFHSDSSVGDKIPEEAVTLDYSDEEVFVDEQSVTNDTAGLSKAGRNI